MIGLLVPINAVESHSQLLQGAFQIRGTQGHVFDLDLQVLRIQESMLSGIELALNSDETFTDVGKHSSSI